jgi:N-acetylmuramoyl-L-alanine amidase
VTFRADSTLAANVHPAANVEPRRAVARPRLLILHYTGMSSAAKAIDWLARAESGVSCHYVIDEAGVITQMVPERMRAWHAGVSCWRGERDINSHSIGIEIQNPGHADGYPDFSRRQMAAVIALGRDIVTRNGIAPDGLLAHSDVAPARKIDPGEKFNWAELARHGLGAWVRPSPIRAGDDGLGLGASGEAVRSAQALLTGYGYEVAVTGELDAATSKVLRAFQLHFRPRRIDGRLDRSTLLTLTRLISATRRNAVA